MTRRLYRALLLLYPAEHRAVFASEMLLTFDRAATHRGRSLRFALAELRGLAAGLFSEWLARWTNPAGYISHRCDPVPAEIPLEVSELQKHLRLLISRLEFAIAHHDFPGARYYAYREQIARERLSRLLGL